MSPLGNSGIDIDPTTGKPRTRQRAEPESDKYCQAVMAASELVADLQSEGGQKVLVVIEALIMERVEELTKNDPACSKLIELLDRLGRKINLAPAYAEKVMKKKLAIRPPR